MNTNFFSENIPEGTAFESRAEIKDIGLHKHLVHGISANEDGAFSVVVAGGYVDDEDFGDEIYVYRNIYSKYKRRSDYRHGGGFRYKIKKQLS